MKQPDMEQLMADIQQFLNTSEPDGDAAALDGEVEAPDAGRILPLGNPAAMAWVGRVAKWGSFAAEGLTILLLAGVATVGWASWVHLGLALAGILAAGLVSSMLLLGLHARIALLVEIETNTRRIADNKERIASLLERIWIA